MRIVIENKLVVIALVTFITLCSTAYAAEPAKKDYQKIADAEQWWWPDDGNLVDCIRHADKKYGLSITRFGDSHHYLTLSILRDGKTVYTWKGHNQSVFDIVGDKLYYAEFEISRTGGKIVAIDLSTGKELWASELKALGLNAHFDYLTQIRISCNEEIATIKGNESMGKYLEYKSVDTGETVGHRIFEKKE